MKYILKKILVISVILFASISIYSLSCADDLKLLQQLSNAPGVSGFEGPVRDILKSYWKRYKASPYVDNVGNLISKSHDLHHRKIRILIMAHMDEVGLLITHINPAGYIRTIALGGILDYTLWSQQWLIYNKNVIIPAVSGIDPPHVLSNFTKTPVLARKKFFLDTTLSKKQLLDKGVRPGLPVVSNTRFRIMANPKYYMGKAFDDRVGDALITELINYIHQKNFNNNIDIVFAATVQEELGMRGAKNIYNILKPDIVINLEAGIAKDYPCDFVTDKQPVLGGGPTLFIYDGSMLPNNDLVEYIVDTAKKYHIPYQWESENSYGEDASAIQFSGQGVAAINIGVPLRYIHSNVGIMNKDDYSNTLKLLSYVLKNLNSYELDKIATIKI